LAGPDSTTPLRGAVLGLGMIGRHHARLLEASPRIEFAGAVDPAGDRFGVVHDASRLVASVDELLAAGAPDFAVVAVPTEEHVAVTRRLAAAGVHVLVEKPLAATADEGRALIAIVREAGVHAAVGHVERFNPALLELRRRTQAGQLGQVFLIATERIGPFPDRVRDVGVVKDLATHDLDLVRWLGGAPVERVAAETQHRMDRDHEDLVLATGSLESGVSFNCVVDWLSPTKVRRTRALGERGMLVADTLTADLSFYANGDVTSEWDATQSLRGVSEGDMTRYALSRREPLLAELEAFCDLLEGDADAQVVTLAEGLEAVLVAEAVLDAAGDRGTVALEARRGVHGAGEAHAPGPGAARSAQAGAGSAQGQAAHPGTEGTPMRGLGTPGRSAR
jgi:UDP-N-acetylglucosamine 3-dehydrogenase